MGGSLRCRDIGGYFLHLLDFTECCKPKPVRPLAACPGSPNSFLGTTELVIWRQVLSLKGVGWHRQSSHAMSERRVQRRREALLSPLMVPPVSLEAYQLDGSSVGINHYKVGWGLALPDLRCVQCVHAPLFFCSALPAGGVISMGKCMGTWSSLNSKALRSRMQLMQIYWMSC